LDPNLAEGYKALGNIYDVKEEFQTALNNYMNAVRLNPNYAAAISNIGFIYSRLGSFDESLKWMKKAMTIEPGRAMLSSNVGLQYFNLGFDSLAASWLKKAIELQPEFFFPNIILTLINIYDHKYDQARELIMPLLNKYPKVPIILTTAGDIELLSGNLRKAKEYYQKSVEFSSPLSDGGTKLAYTLSRLNEKAKANKILELYFTTESEDLNSYKENTETYLYASAYCIAHKDQQAINLLHRAFELGYRDYRWIMVDPAFDTLRNNPEFVSIVTSIKLKIDEMRNHVKNDNLYK
jgi:tetratricopeptide (TPR) repeat protein